MHLRYIRLDMRKSTNKNTMVLSVKTLMDLLLLTWSDLSHHNPHSRFPAMINLWLTRSVSHSQITYDSTGWKLYNCESIHPIHWQLHILETQFPLVGDEIFHSIDIYASCIHIRVKDQDHEYLHHRCMHPGGQKIYAWFDMDSVHCTCIMNICINDTCMIHPEYMHVDVRGLAGLRIPVSGLEIWGSTRLLV